MAARKYTDIKFEIKDKIGIIKLNRPKSLNAFGGNLLRDVVTAMRDLDEHPHTVFTVLTGEGRFFSSGADVKATASREQQTFFSDSEKKVNFLAGLTYGLELIRSIIDHKKVVVLALNGPAIGAGGAWFLGAADIVLAAKSHYLQIPFSALGLVPENGSSTIFSQSMGVHRANDILMFGRKCSAEELEQWGIVNRIFETEGFQDSVVKFLEEQLEINDGKSMMETKRLQNAPLRDGRMVAAFNAMNALAERTVDGELAKRFAEKKKLLEAKSKSRSKL